MRMKASGRIKDTPIDVESLIAQTLAPFDRHQSAYSALLGEFALRVDIFYRDVEGRIQKGIALNDSGQFDEALATYDSVLKGYPRSAWAHYERYQTLLTRSQTEAPSGKERFSSLTPAASRACPK